MFRYCRAQARFIEAIQSGGRVLVEVDEWVNKTRGQAEVKVIRQDPDGEEEAEGLNFFAGVQRVPEFVERVFPWASVDVDESFYDLHEEVDPLAVFQDDESPGGHYVVPGERQTGLRPYESDGEVDRWRLELTLNEIGSAYVAITRAGRGLAAPPQ